MHHPPRLGHSDVLLFVAVDAVDVVHDVRDLCHDAELHVDRDVADVGVHDASLQRHARGVVLVVGQDDVDLELFDDEDLNEVAFPPVVEFLEVLHEVRWFPLLEVSVDRYREDLADSQVDLETGSLDECVEVDQSGGLGEGLHEVVDVEEVLEVA